MIIYFIYDKRSFISLLSTVVFVHKISTNKKSSFLNFCVCYYT